MFGVAVSLAAVVTPRMVLVPSAPAQAPPVAAGKQRPAGAGGSVLVTGGLGDVGRLVGVWLSERGASPHVVLLGRNGRARGHVASLNTSSATGCITTASCDAASAADVQGLMQVINARADVPPFSAVLHASAVLRDALLIKQTAGSLRAVYAPKVTGAQVLMKASAALPITILLHFSSLSAQVWWEIDFIH